jgi:hypothetical protein
LGKPDRYTPEGIEKGLETMAVKRAILRGTVLGFLLWAVLPVVGAQASPSVSVTSCGPGNCSDFRGDNLDVEFQANAPTGSYLKHVEWSLTGPGANVVERDPSSGEWASNAPGDTYGNSWTYTPAQLRYNGTYTFTVEAYDSELSGASRSTSITIKVNRAPSTPGWASGPSAGKDNGQPYVDLSWRYTGTEPDMREYWIERSGPDGTVIAAISAVDPGKQGCSASGTNGNKTFACRDTVFNASGSYSYKIWSLRKAGATTGVTCRLDASGTPFPQGTTNPTACIRSAEATSVQGASVEMPPPPSPDGSGGTGGGGGKKTGTSTSGGTTGFRPPPPGQHLIPGQASASPNTDYRDFYTGEYSTHLPYQDRTLLLPGGKLQVGGNRETQTEEEVTSSTPLGVPLKDRALLLPLAAGLLLFLGAAHVKRLLTDR